MPKNLQSEWEKATPIGLESEWEKATPVEVNATKEPQAELSQSDIESPNLYGFKGAGEALLQTAKNIPGSAKEFGEGIVSAVSHPIETTKTLGKLATLDEETYDKVSQVLVDRYGSMEAFNKTLINDPFGAAADISTILSGVGGATRAVGTIGKLGTVAKVGEAMGEAGKLVNPLSIATSPVKLARKGIAATGLPEQLYSRTMKIPPGSVSDAVRERIVNTLIYDERLPLNKKTLGKMNNIVNEIETSTRDIIKNVSQAGANIDVTEVAKGLDNLKKKYANRSDPQKYYKAIDEIKADYIEHDFVDRVSKMMPSKDKLSNLYGWGEELQNVPTGKMPVEKAHLLKKGTYQEIQEYYNQRIKPETGRVGIQNKYEAAAKAEAAKILRDQVINHPDIPASVAKELSREAGIMESRKWVERALNRGGNIDPIRLSGMIYGIMSGSGIKSAVAFQIAMSQRVLSSTAIALANGSKTAKLFSGIARPGVLTAYQAGRLTEPTE